MITHSQTSESIASTAIPKEQALDYIADMLSEMGKIASAAQLSEIEALLGFARQAVTVQQAQNKASEQSVM